ncbi:hypothetical protein F441_20545 [Phytophthora nicotianae CJ01A1]|uniref:Uncharacterized protein n=4 Tax=Phytophthora nicotianae TaxID=4792 RepID=V9E0A2_PHYNI|nr:hypothetical protein F443_20675 [Phytophthora nicotianae P1569]ETM32825.1 hypothetical protein L914_19861 [Phytophthora nicotianae]ETO61275.1 hypothetical protein F444_20694 [Phytophthora nicotianae P1976]ETP02382.1 hypothetical protein F441_20545 [Phytophthora nicotianae CJ01A1]KUF84471.1 hypothetical protein AM587_10012740 [Phytophthora nicotianae]
MKTALLREVDVKIARVKPRGECSPSPEYVFAIRPRSRSHHEALIARRQDLDHATTLGRDNVPVIHEVPRTYSACRALYRKLQHLTDCKNVRACCCALGSCPFWSLFAVLGSIEFPKRTLFNHQSKHVFAQRTQALDAMMRTIVAVLRSNYRIRHFRCYQAPYGAAHVCKVLVTLCLFLELNEADVEQRLLEGGERLAYKLNLQGWQSDRVNLYFHCEDKKKYRKFGEVREHKSMELRQSLTLSDCAEKEPTSVMSDSEEEQPRSSLQLVWS